MEEYDAGLHPLTEADKEALLKSSNRLIEMLEEEIHNCTIQSFPA